MVEENLVKSDFARFANANISVDYSTRKCKYVIETGMSFSLYITEDTDFDQYKVILKHDTGKTYELSAYDDFKEYIKKHTKKMFGKKNMNLHMKAISEYVNFYKNYFTDTEVLDVFLTGKVKGTPDIFIA